jgi:acid stress-induced BolA-like protein IbaG/YrbA
MEQRLREVLRELGYTDDEIFLEAAGGGKVAGYIISEAFRGESQINRQDQLWAKLRQHLGPDELIKIVAVLTMTPTEAAS